ncbi:MAG: hypothetical protein GMKNLPBB_00819 [Myxococcota bacterium]|nr:hypothetical protein [Myxococcota bacterium]
MKPTETLTPEDREALRRSIENPFARAEIRVISSPRSPGRPGQIAAWTEPAAGPPARRYIAICFGREGGSAGANERAAWGRFAVTLATPPTLAWEENW